MVYGIRYNSVVGKRIFVPEYFETKQRAREKIRQLALSGKNPRIVDMKNYPLFRDDIVYIKGARAPNWAKGKEAMVVDGVPMLGLRGNSFNRKNGRYKVVLMDGSNRKISLPRWTLERLRR